MKTFVSKPTHIIAVQYTAGHSEMHTELIDLVGQERVAWMNHGVVAIMLDDTGDRTLVHDGEWIALCTDGCLHIFSDAEIHDLFEEVHP